jgi:Na+/H+ antiporter 1
VAVVLLLGFKLRRGPPYFVLGSAMWVVALESGIEPLVVGLAFGLLVSAAPAARSDLEHAGKRFREFREQPTPKLQRVARESIRTAISPNERLQLIYHPWTSYVVVPLFALANAGIATDGDFLERAGRSPITLGVLVGYVAGKPLGIVGTALLVTRLSRGRLRPTVGWGPSQAQARAPASASASPSRCSSPRWPSTAHSSRRPRPAPRRRRGRGCPHVAGVPHHRTAGRLAQRSSSAMVRPRHAHDKECRSTSCRGCCAALHIGSLEGESLNAHDNEVRPMAVLNKLRARGIVPPEVHRCWSTRSRRSSSPGGSCSTSTPPPQR